MFHHFHGLGHPIAQGSISDEEMEAMLLHVGVKRFVSAQEFATRVLENSLRGDEVCISFDDNLLCQYDVALPVLKKYSLTAFWFVFTGSTDGEAGSLEVFRHFRTVCFQSIDEFYEQFFADLENGPLGAEVKAALVGVDLPRYLAEAAFYSLADRKFRYIRDKILGAARYNFVMTSMMKSFSYDPVRAADSLWMRPEHWNELDREGHVIGLHTHNHPTDLAALPVEMQRSEYFQNFRSLEQVLQKKPFAVSHPCNSYSAETLTVLKDLGISLGFRANMLKIPAPSLLELPREDHTNLLREIKKA